MNKITEVLMRRDGMSKEEAEIALQFGRDRLLDGDDPQDILEEEFGLEPDYVFDLFP